MKIKNLKQFKKEDAGKVKLLDNATVQYHFFKMWNKLCRQCRIKIHLAQGKMNYNDLLECEQCKPVVLATETKVNNLLRRKQ
jgi:hypothetical protein